MMSSIISGLIAGLVAAIVCAWVSKRARESAIEGDLRFGAFLPFMGSCSLVLVGLVLSGLLMDPDFRSGQDELLVGLAVLLIFTLIGVYSFTEYARVRGSFDEAGIDFHSPWTGSKTEEWADLEALSFNRMAGWYVLRFRSGSIIRLSTLLRGHGDVLDLLKSKGHQVRNHPDPSA